jgi:hypothetical protein
MDRPREVRLVIGLLHHHRVGHELLDFEGVAADEDVAGRTAAEDSLDNGEAASFAQMFIDDHQIRFAAFGRGDRTLLRPFDSADLVAHSLEDLGEQVGDDGLIFDDQYTQ